MNVRGARAASPMQGQLRALLVEDNPGDAELVREALSNCPISLDHVVRVGDALDRLAAGGSDVVLLDLTLPDASGLETLTLIKRGAPKVPIVVLTGTADAELGTRAVRAGAEDYLPKSAAQEHTLFRVVCHAVERHRYREHERLLAVEHAARQEAEASSRLKDEFLAILAHELRNPLAPLRFALDIAQRPTVAADARQRSLAIASRQMAQLVRLVDDLIDISRINRGSIPLSKDTVTLRALLRASMESALPFIEAGDHRLHVSEPEADVWVEADPARVIQVLTNLLNNAAKFTPRGGTIWVRATLEKDAIVICVRDSGRGIPPHALHQVFDLYHRVGGDTAPSAGLGIGLTLAKRLIELHGGSIEARSEGAGRGAEFIVTLPGVVVDRVHADGPSNGHPPASPLRVVIVDDNLDAVETLQVVVSLAGHETRTAHNGRSALALIAEFQPHAALLDIGMPEMDGYELARRVRELPIPPPKLIAVTGWGQEEDRRRARAAGFDFHVTKPADAGVIMSLLAAVALERDAEAAAGGRAMPLTRRADFSRIQPGAATRLPES